MPIDFKYGRVTLEHGESFDDPDEPVVVFRARDMLLPDTMHYYANRCRAAGSPWSHLESIAAARRAVEAWQAEHGK